MTPAFNKVHNRFKLNGTHFNFKDLKELGYSFVKEGQVYEEHIGQFLLDWQDNNTHIQMKTSGSTGLPKTVEIPKQALVNSAIATGDYFKLKPGDRALLCLPAHYIAGKMMLVRAMILGLEIECIEPKSKLHIDLDKQYDFAAMVPLQLEHSMDAIDNITQMIIGGAKISNALILKIQELKTSIYETYGMTETVSHIAVKQINHLKKGEVPVFKTLPNISITQDERNCLVIEAPQITKERIMTNDMVKLHSNTTFEWLGRIDNIINTGGIKVHPEQIENVLDSKIESRFFIASEPDASLGERIVLVVEGAEESVHASAFNVLSKHEKPKVIYYINSFIETASGKVQRKKTLQRLKK
ncbi:AMP-binding protein [Lacinutrix neustonica]|uniref:AMP-binding protein n=1 Tax=Lacinutrix neustonica TaxID=2980107 RepID=A0A9E8SDZ4_9FLAO|nr:AMP-binding protein [Lacinutrix neustonica]WAC02616.1 AMP-binding protein [Lacinutrix neustonica]